jgi:hypothetical protein
MIIDFTFAILVYHHLSILTVATAPYASHSSWTSDSTISLSFKTGQASKLGVGDSFSLIVGVVGAKCLPGRTCSSNLKSLGRNVATPLDYSTDSGPIISIQAPAVNLYPTVVLSIPTELSACNSLTVDLSASTGAGGRPWRSVIFTVEATNGDLLLAPYLNANYSYNTNTVVVPKSILASATFEITVAVENFFGNKAYRTSRVTVTGSKHL